MFSPEFKASLLKIGSIHHQVIKGSMNNSHNAIITQICLSLSEILTKYFCFITYTKMYQS